MRSRRYIILISIALLSACTTVSSVPELPDSLDGDGLLVGKIYMPGSYRWNNSQVIINGKTYSTSLRDGYLAIKLSPGEYTLQSLRTTGWNEKVSQRIDESPYVKVRGGSGGYRAPTYTYVPGTTSTTHYTLLPINQKFTIEANRATSIGMYVFIVDPKEPKKFYTLKLDNRKEMAHFLDTNYPKLMEGLADRNPLTAQASYLDAAKLQDLRRAIVASEISNGRFIRLSQGIVVYGDAGTVALLTPDKTKKDAPPTTRVLDTGTLADIKGVQSQGDRLSFLTSDAQILILHNGQIVQRAMSHRVQPLQFRRFGQQGIVVVDNRRRFLASADDGLTWTRDESVMLEKPTNRLGMYATRDGVYVYSALGVPDSIILRNHADATPQVIPAPVERGRIPAYSFSRLFSTDAGLYIDYMAQDFHFRANGQKDWQLRAAPAGKCGFISADGTGRKLNITCDKTGYRSDDDGLTWIKRESPAPKPAPATSPAT